MRCAIYRRVSTNDQVQEGFSLEAQKMRLTAYVQSQGWNLIEDYVDEGFSAKNIERPAMQRLMKDIEKQKFDVILVYRLDRFVRSVSDLHSLLQLMDKHDVKFKSATEVFETTSASGRLFITIIATLAQWERETIAERVFENMLKRSEQGKRNGAPAPFGYDLVDGNLVINEQEAKWVRFMFDKYHTHGSQNIAKQLNNMGVKTKRGEVWSDFAVRYVLRNPINCGYIRWNYRSNAKGKFTGEEVVKPIDQENFNPIIEKNLFDEIQKIYKSRSNMAFKSNNHYPFSGIAVCSCCGKTFSGCQRKRKSGSMYRFYKCQGRFKFGICNVQAISEEAIEKAFLDILDIKLTVPALEEKKNHWDLVLINKKKQQLMQKKERAEELYIEGNIDKGRYLLMIEKVNDEEFELIEIEKQFEEDASYEDILNVVKLLKSKWYDISHEAKKRAIHSLFKSITIEVVEPTKMGKYPEPPIVKIKDYQYR